MRLDLSCLSPRRRKVAAVSAVAVAVAGICAVTATLPAFAATGCNVTYTDSSWTENTGTGGFTANISVTNLGDPMTAWTLKFTLPSGQTLGQGWSANWTSSGTAVTATNLSYNGSLSTGASTGIGFNGRWSGTYSSPTAFTLNGVTCNGGGSTSGAPSSSASSPGASSSASPSSSPSSSTPPCTTDCPAHVDNPYAGAKGYVNPEWKAKADAEPAAAGSPTPRPPSGWTGSPRSHGTSTSMGLRAHLDAALTQDAASGCAPLVVQFVIYNLPGRDCSALASNGELPGRRRSEPLQDRVHRPDRRDHGRPEVRQPAHRQHHRDRLAAEPGHQPRACPACAAVRHVPTAPTSRASSTP